MNLGAVLLGLIDVAIYCAIVIFVAFAILWVLQTVGFPPSGEMLKWGKIIVMLLCLAVIVAWLLSLLGVAPYYGPHFLLRATP